MLTKFRVFDLSDIIEYMMFNYDITLDQSTDIIDIVLFAKYESLRSKNIIWVHDPYGNFLDTDTILIESMKEYSIEDNTDFKHIVSLARMVDDMVNDTVLSTFWNSVDRTDSPLDVFERRWLNRCDILLEVV